MSRQLGLNPIEDLLRNHVQHQRIIWRLRRLGHLFTHPSPCWLKIAPMGITPPPRLCVAPAYSTTNSHGAEESLQAKEGDMGA